MNYAERIVEVQARIRVAAGKSGRRAEEIALVAVSKKQTMESIRAVYDLGIRDFGENYVQELSEKGQGLFDLKDIRWHLIGPLQSNKLKKALEFISQFHALSDFSLAEKMKRQIASKGARTLKTYLQVNIDEEATKSGLGAVEVEAVMAQFQNLSPELELSGLMCIPNPDKQGGERRNSFKKMHELRLRCQNKIGRPLLLSMGMTDDFEMAIEEGADLVRVGRLIFGERLRKDSNGDSKI